MIIFSQFCFVFQLCVCVCEMFLHKLHDKFFHKSLVSQMSIKNIKNFSVFTCLLISSAFII